MKIDNIYMMIYVIYMKTDRSHWLVIYIVLVLFLWRTLTDTTTLVILLFEFLSLLIFKC